MFWDTWVKVEGEGKQEKMNGLKRTILEQTTSKGTGRMFNDIKWGNSQIDFLIGQLRRMNQSSNILL